MTAATLAVLSQRPAARAETDLRPRAQALLADGVERLEHHDPEGALAQFEAAAQLVPNAKIQFNIGLAQEALMRPAAAVTAYLRYLDEATNDTPARRSEAAQHIAGLRTRVTYVELRAPRAWDGDAVRVDGAQVARVPLRVPLVIEPGAHELSVGDRPWRRQLVAAAGGTVSVVPPPDGLAMGAADTGLRRDESGGEAAATHPSWWRSPWTWVAVGAVAAGAVTAALVLSGSAREPTRACPSGVTPCLEAR